MIMENKKNKINKKNNIILEIFDSMFIMILCFATLLSAMLMQSEDAKISYIINYKTLFITFIGLAVYLTFMLSQSQKGLNSMIKHIYKNESSEEEDAK